MIHRTNSGRIKASPAIVILMLIVLLLAAWLRVYRIEAQSLWYDEGNSAAMVGRAIPQIITAAAGDIHPPLYYFLLAGWGALAGKTELALRMLSAFCSIGAVAVTYALGVRLFDWRAGLLAAFLVAVNPFQVYYAQEARMYMLVALLTALSIWLSARVLTIPGAMLAGRFDPLRAAGVVIAYILVNAAGLYTHYTFPAVLVAETLVFVVWLLRRGQKLHGLLIWVALQGATLFLFAPWMPILLHQLETWPRLTAGGVGILDVLDTMTYGVTLPAEVALGGVGMVILLALVGLLPPPDRRRDRRYLRFSERAGLVVGWLVMAVAIPAAQGAIREPTLKFLLPGNLALMLLAARGLVLGWDIGAEGPAIAQESGLLVRIVVLALAFFGFSPFYAGLQNLYFDPAYARDDYRAIAARIRQEGGDNPTVILDAPNQQEVFGYYYPAGAQIVPLPAARTRETLARLLAVNPRLYVLFWGQSEQDPGGVVESALQAGAFEVDSTWYGKVRLVTYAVAGPPAAQIAHRLSARFGDSIILDGYTLQPETLSAGSALGVTLFWHTEAHIPIGYKVFVHLYKTDGTILAQHDSEPSGGLKPTHQWQVSEPVVDNHGLLIPPGTPPGSYNLMIGMYDEHNNRLPITTDGNPVGDRLLIGVVTVQ